MKAVIFRETGTTPVIKYEEKDKPVPTADDLLVKVHAAGLNRVDLMQLLSDWDPADFASSVPGIEISGEVVEIGSRTKGFKKGDKVFGFVNGGAFAQYALLDGLNAIPLPEGWNYVQGAAIAEVFLTSNERLFTNGKLKERQTVLIHAGGSGIGTAAIQLAHLSGATVIFTAGSDEKIKKCLTLGAHLGINYKTQDFQKEVLKLTNGTGADLIIDCIGASYLERNLQSLKTDGTLVVLGVMGGAKAEINILEIILKRHTIVGNNLTRRKVEEQREVTKRFVERWYPALMAGKIKPIIDTVFPIEKIGEAFQYMRENRNFGKIIIEVAH